MKLSKLTVNLSAIIKSFNKNNFFLYSFTADICGLDFILVITGKKNVEN